MQKYEDLKETKKNCTCIKKKSLYQEFIDFGLDFIDTSNSKIKKIDKIKKFVKKA